MTEEIISEVKVIDSGKLLLVLKSGGDNSYQYVYREAAGVNWEPDLKGFISTEPKEWSYSTWFSHMIEIVKHIGIDLKLTSQTKWSGLDKSEQQQILKVHAKYQAHQLGTRTLLVSLLRRRLRRAGRSCLV